MIHNPYAKKRQRPSGWTSTSSLTQSSAPVVQQPTLSTINDADREPFNLEPRNSQTRRGDKPLDLKENATNRRGDQFCKRNISSRIPNEFEQSAHPTKNHSNCMSTKSATTERTTEMTHATSYHPSIKTLPRVSAKNIANSNAQHDKSISADRILPMASTVSNSSRNTICNPYMRKKTAGTYVSSSTAKSFTPHENNACKVHPNPSASRSIGPSITGVHESKPKTSLMLSSSDPSHFSKCEAQSKISCSVGSAAVSKTDSGKPLANLPSSIASIRPASWKVCDDKSNQSIVGSSDGASMSEKRKTGAQCSLRRNDKIEDAMDRLPRELSYTPDEVKPIQDEYRLPLIKNANLSSPLKNGWMLFPHQKKAIIRALTMRRMILALDMGLGKTLIGTVWSKAFKETFGQEKLKIFVVCPVSLKEEWKRTAEESVGLDVDDQGRDKSKGKRKKATEKKRTQKGRTVSELSRERSNCAETKMKMTICSWAKVPKVVESGVEHFVVCCDEAHAMQSTQAQRTKDVLNLVNDKRCVGVLLLTGTPMKNGKPGNLFPLLKAVRHPLGRHQKAFEAHFCNGMLKNFGRGPQWDASGASNLDQLKQKVTSNLLHMTKEQCLTELPPMTTIFRDVPVSSRYQVQYEHSIKYLASVQANSSNMRDEAVLGAVQRLRVVCAHAKVEATVEMARTILNKEPAVVIFTYFAQIAKNVHSKLQTSGWPCSLLTGDTPQNKRQELVDNFQNGLSSVFVCTFGAGGVGLTLTAASTIILLDRPWTPGETRQAEDRIRRIGQVKKCTSYWMRSFDLDKQIDKMLESKNQTTNAVLDKNQNNDNISGPSAKISINQLIQKFVLSEIRKKL